MPSNTQSPLQSQDAGAPLRMVQLGSNGPVVVMLHGWGRSLDVLRPLGELLASRFRVMLIDLPGFGGSPAPFSATNAGGGWGTAEYCSAVVQLLNQHNVERCILFGHSLGGRIAVRLAAQHPLRIAALILTGAAGIPRKRSWREQARINLIRWCVRSAKWIDQTFGTRIFPHYLANRFGSADYRAAGDLRHTLVKIVQEDLRAEAATVTAPTLLLWGARDTETPLDVAQAYNQLIRGSQLIIFPNKGHEPFTDVGAHPLCRYIERFVEQINP